MAKPDFITCAARLAARGGQQGNGPLHRGGHDQLAQRQLDQERVPAIQTSRPTVSGTKLRERADSGFTLLELLIATTILGLMLVALTGGVRFAGQAWDTQQRRSNLSGDLDA